MRQSWAKYFERKSSLKFVWSFPLLLSQCCKEKKLGSVAQKPPQNGVEGRRERKKSKFGTSLIIYIHDGISLIIYIHDCSY